LDHKPEDIRPKWLNAARRLQSLAKPPAHMEDCGYSVMVFRVLLDDQGDPVLWEKPVRVQLEPKSACKNLLSNVMSMVKGDDL
jgi:hypothetical protein